MAIQNKKPKPKASGKTDAMKALNAPMSDAEVLADGTTDGTEAAATTTAARPLPASAIAPRPIVRPAPIFVKPVVRQAPKPAAVVEESEESDADAKDLSEGAGQKVKIAFDPQVWQWRDQGGFIHIKTGEVREETDFLDPDAKSRNASDDDWDAPQSGGDDW